MRPLFAFGTVIVLASVFACYDPPSEHYVPPVCPPLDQFKASADGPEVSFRKDVLPNITLGCDVDTCHGSKGSGNLKLSNPDTVGLEKAATTIYGNLVNKAADAHKTMKRVVPGDPNNSFLMHKLDGDQCALDATTCNHDDCGVSMPQDGDLLPDTDRAVIRKWIMQGAKDN